jgi:pimeloyl-ACP methyl ester carboxylesterase
VSPVRHETVTANGVEFALLTEGPPSGPLALCLHGFPDTAHTWRHLLPRLAAAGYRAVAPFMRGYAPTAIPPDGRFDVGTLARDAESLHEVLDGDADAVLLGHDWGALAAYGAAAHQPDRWRRLVTAAVAPPAAMAAGLLTYDQLRRSWYIYFFQSPLAEHAVGADGHAFIDRLWADWSPAYDGAEDAARVKESIGDAAHLGAALGYYRALFAGPPDDPETAAALAASSSVPPQPTLYLHGRDDGCMGIDAMGPVTDFLAPGSRMVVVDGAGHFAHLEQPDLVGDTVVAFLTE